MSACSFKLNYFYCTVRIRLAGANQRNFMNKMYEIKSLVFHKCIPSLKNWCVKRSVGSRNHESKTCLTFSCSPSTVSYFLIVLLKLPGTVITDLNMLTSYFFSMFSVFSFISVTLLRSFIPDKHMVFCPEQLLRVILAHIHYMPDHWQGNAHRYETRDQFSQLFQYKAVSIRKINWSK